MSIRKTTLALLCIGTFLSGFGQQVERCGTVEYMQMLREANPSLGTEASFETWLAEKMATRANTHRRDVVTLPIVFHIIHNGEAIGSGQNQASSKVTSQIRILNEDFRRRDGTPGFNDDPVGADAEIEFCGATLAPNDEFLDEPGVNRIDRRDRGWTAPPYASGYINSVIKPSTIWDPTKYINVWVLPIDGSNNQPVLGIAQFPVQSGLDGLFGTNDERTDGVVINSQAFGQGVGNFFNFNRGRTLTHELGHFFGLRHVHGDSQSCGIDDFCDDTPQTTTNHFGCPVGAINCDSEDMVRNYMTTTNDACMNIFTQCQSVRMQTVLENSPRRRELISSDRCAVPTVAPIANFAFGDTIVSCDGRVQLMDDSQNLPTSYAWSISNGTTASSKNPFVLFENSGEFEISLTVMNEFGSDTKSQLVFIRVDGAPVDAGEDLEECSGSEITLNVNTGVEGASYLWLPQTGLDNSFSPSPVLTIGGIPLYTVTVTFPSGCQVVDSIEVTTLISPNTIALPPGTSTIQAGESLGLNAIGAQSFSWSPTAGLSNPNIANPLATPDTTTTYVVAGMNDNGCTKLDSVTIIVEGTTNISEAFDKVGKVHTPFPNPASTSISFSAAFLTAGKLRVELLDLQGQKVAIIEESNVFPGQKEILWERKQIAAGVYMVQWQLNDARFLQKVVLY